jgi:hypothetical protein
MTDKRIRVQLKKLGKQTAKSIRSAAWQTCLCVGWVVCSPCMCCALLLFPLRRRKPRIHHRIELPMVPSPRRRALTIPSTDWQNDQTTQDQPQSAFMTKLPLEIRRIVCEKALGGAEIQLWVSRGHLIAYRGNLLPPNDCTMEPVNLALTLLRTCRRM